MCGSSDLSYRSPAAKAPAARPAPPAPPVPAAPAAKASGLSHAPRGALENIVRQASEQSLSLGRRMAPVRAAILEGGLRSVPRALLEDAVQYALDNDYEFEGLADLAPAPAPALTRTAAALALAEVMAKDSWQAVHTTSAEPRQYSGHVLYPQIGRHNQAVVDALEAFRKAAPESGAPVARPGTAEAFALAEKLSSWSDWEGDLMTGPKEDEDRDVLVSSEDEYVQSFRKEIVAFRRAVGG